VSRLRRSSRPEREPAGSQRFFDLVERLVPELRSLQQLGLDALDQVANAVDVLVLQASKNER